MDGDTVIVYQVFCDIHTNRYQVQQVDSLSEKSDLQSFQQHLASQKHIAVQVFLERSAANDVVKYDTIVDAIAAFGAKHDQMGNLRAAAYNSNSA